MAREWISNEGNEWEGCWKSKYAGKNEILDKVAFEITEQMKYFDRERISYIDENKGGRDEWCVISNILQGMEEAMMCLIKVAKEVTQK